MKTFIKTALVVVALFAAFVIDIWPTDVQLPDPAQRYEETPLYQATVSQPRGKILAVVTSTDEIGTSGKRTGYELTELSRAYYVFTSNGYEVEITSPEGGEAPMLIDDEDMGMYDFAFLNDPVAIAKVENTRLPAELDPADYSAIYFVGGKGAMFDFPDDVHLQNLTASIYASGGVVAGVCHGPAGLLNVEAPEGGYLLDGRRVSAFTNAEELFLIPDAADLFPFLLEDELVSRGAVFSEGDMYLENVVADGRIVTGQNPWSTWETAEQIVIALGHRPVVREPTATEHSVEALRAYFRGGYSAAVESVNNSDDQDSLFLAMYTIVQAMRGEYRTTFDLIRLNMKVN